VNTPNDPDRLLALALTHARGPHLRLVRTHQEICLRGKTCENSANAAPQPLPRR
jgi:hypothetical protein